MAKRIKKDKDEWWVWKSKKNDPHQSEYQEFTGFDTLQNVTWSNSSPSKLNVPYDTNAVPGLYNSQESLQNQKYVQYHQQMSQKQYNQQYNQWSIASSGWNGAYYNSNYSESEEVLRKSQPIIDYLTKVLQFR